MKETLTNIEKHVRHLLAKRNVFDITVTNLKNLLGAEGYRVIFFQADDLSENTMRLFAVLDVMSLAAERDSFTYNNGSQKIVFVRDGFDEKETLYLLSLELGRILYTEMPQNAIVYGTPKQERKAAAFADVLIGISEQSTATSFFHYFRRRAVLVTALLTVLLNIFVSCGVYFYLSGIVSFRDGSMVLYEPSKETSIMLEDMPIKDSAMEALATDRTDPKDAFDTLNSPDGFDSAETISSDPLEIVVNSEDVEEASLPNDSPSFKLEESEIVYYATPNGTKYHLPGCSYIKNKTTVTLDKNAVVAGGYAPCSRCFKEK